MNNLIIASINELGPKPLNKYLKLFGGWPVIEGEGWDQNNFDFLNLMTKIRNSGFENQFFFSLRIAPDFRRNTKYSIFVKTIKFEINK